MKIFNISKLSCELFNSIYREIILLRELEICNNIVHLYEVYKSDNNIYLVLNYARYGPLLNYLNDNANI